MSTITIRWYAQLKEMRGQSEEEVALVAGETLAELYARLLASTPQPPVVAFACNHQVCQADHQPQAGDLVVFLPPLGGG